MKVTLWGTRGSLAVAGPDTARYGGNTACVEVRGADGAVVILDAGTGIRRLGDRLSCDKCARLNILLSHLHMDHIQGLGVFKPLFQPGVEVNIWGPPSSTFDLRARLSRYLSPPLFPVRIRDLPCRLTLEDVPRGPVRIGSLEVVTDLVCHPGPTVGYRISEGGISMAYLPDHEPALGAQGFPSLPDWTSGYELATGVDLLIHDAQYTDEEYAEHMGWGHSSITQALAIAALCGVKRLVTFHHDPAHDDHTLDRLLNEARRAARLPFELAAGREGRSFEI